MLIGTFVLLHSYQLLLSVKSYRSSTEKKNEKKKTTFCGSSLGVSFLFIIIMSEVERLNRNKQRASFKCNAAASHIESIYALGVSASTESFVIPKFLSACEDLCNYWETFTLENDAMLEAMIELCTEKEFSNNVELEVRNTLLNAKTLAHEFRSTSDVSMAISEVNNNDKPDTEIDNVESVSNPTAEVG